MRAKLPKESDLLIRPELLESLAEIDALIFALDGVLVDVSESTQLAACETVQRYLQTHCQWRPGGALLDRSDAVALKRDGGFRSDRELVQAAVLYLLSKAQRCGSTAAEDLAGAPPTLTEFLDELQRRGGGLQAAEHALMPADSPERRRELTLQWNQKLIVRLFEELYAGEAQCYDLYGFHPEYATGKGYVEAETVLLDASLLPTRIQRLAVMTQRTRPEAELALDRAGILDRIKPQHLLCAEAESASGPATLGDLAVSLGCRRAIAVGASLADLQQVTEYTKTRGDSDPQVFSCQVLSGLAGKQERQLYLERFADAVAPEVNAFLRLLS